MQANKDIKMSASLASMSFQEAVAASSPGKKTEAIQKAKSCISSGLSAKKYLNELKQVGNIINKRTKREQIEEKYTNREAFQRAEAGRPWEYLMMLVYWYL